MKLTEERLMDSVEECEKIGNSSLQKYYKGKTVYFLNSDFVENEYPMNTTISDLEKVCGKVEINAIYNDNSVSNKTIYSIRKANKKEFRNVLKFTHPRTYSMKKNVLFDKDCENEQVLSWNFPMLQNEDFVKNINILEGILKDENISKCAECLTHNSFYTQKNMDLLNEETNYYECIAFQDIICRYFMAKESSAITYLYNDILFVIPVDLVDLKDALKNREKTLNGRKPILPTYVNGFERKGSKVDSFMRYSADGGFVINGKEFGYLLGSDTIPLTFHNNDNGIRKANNFIKNATKDNGYYLMA